MSPKLVEIKEVYASENKLVLKQNLSDTSKQAVLVRIWEAPVELTEQGDKFIGRKANLSIEVPNDDYQVADYWQLPVRAGEIAFHANRQSPIRKLERLCTVTFAAGPTISALSNPAHENLLAAGGRKALSDLNLARVDVSEDRAEILSQTSQLLEATPCRELFPEVKTLPVQQWLASLSCGELCEASEEQLRRRLVRDCEGKPCDEDELRQDLELIVRKRHQLRGRTGIVLA